MTRIDNRPECQTYDIDPAEAMALSALIVVPHESRVRMLRMILEEKGAEKLTDIFSHIIGLANSVIANNREMIELYLMTECNHYPDSAEKINLPTLFGALTGLALTKGIDQEKTCSGCAFRKGTIANQSPITTCDARYQLDNREEFTCHMDGEEMVNYPSKPCRGWAQAMKERKV